MLRFHKFFQKGKCSIIGMVHVGGLPGTPLYCGDTTKIINNAVEDATIYRDSNVDGILVENMHDVPYVRSKDLSPETVSMMTRVCIEIKRILPENIPCGIQILAGCNREAVAVAKAANFQFVRIEGFVFSHIADEGLIDACAGPLLRYRKQIDANDILCFADIKKKHSSHAITSDVSLAETVKAAEFFLADGIILTGIATGDPADITELKEVKQVAKCPILIGSGVTISNMENYMYSDAMIIGSYFKVDGVWKNAVDKKKVVNFMVKLEKLQNIQS
ncbi:uncharacterized protein F13E9.13, mitochondrial isoform X1 [Hylaeus anthracinus]|uniref:uncharacterized protein F13E9.13, mitochondrial isoform X1 n=1 Tax=Hylaeus anthracinus TaxID=313031 RepID=UPI0023B970B6|nr:uncharacterized protein F13E9.13, mitochondrial isoform X1 [Hylaeus anthracinus]